MLTLRTTVAVLFAGSLVLALVLVASQQPFADARFDYGSPLEFRGDLLQSPLLALRTRDGVFPLVAPGKHGAQSPLSGPVTLTATRIYRGRDQMLELEPGSIQPSSRPPLVAATAAEPARPLGPQRLSGEIVDAKCYLGVMNPGAGKTHRSCAARCIRGGVPAALVTKEGEFLWLRSDSNLAPHAGHPVTLSGDLFSENGLRYLRVRHIEAAVAAN